MKVSVLRIPGFVVFTGVKNYIVILQVSLCLNIKLLHCTYICNVDILSYDMLLNLKLTIELAVDLTQR